MPILGLIASSTRQGQSTITGAMEPIASVVVPSGGLATITFGSIPQTYTHLQVRALGRMTNAGTSTDSLSMRFNTATSGYDAHRLLGENTTVYAQNDINQTFINYVGQWPRASSTANAFGVTIIDILDYANTNKYKTIRSLNGSEGNDTNVTDVALSSGLWRSTAAIDTIHFSGSAFSGGLAQYSSFALYGIKGA